MRQAKQLPPPVLKAWPCEEMSPGCAWWLWLAEWKQGRYRLGNPGAFHSETIWLQSLQYLLLGPSQKMLVLAIGQENNGY